MPLSLDDIRAAGLDVEQLPREGRCLVARRPFAEGTTLLRERPIVEASARAVAERVSAAAGAKCPEFTGDYALLKPSPEIQARLASAGAPSPFLAEVETNSFLIGGKVALFHAFSMLNHACAGSREETACFSVLFTGETQIDEHTEVGLIALRDIHEGDPIRISYHELLADKLSKSERLQAHCGGNCGCSLCRSRCSGLDVSQLDFQIPGFTCCQACGKSALATFADRDLVVLEGLRTERYNGCLGRVRKRRADGRVSVALLFRSAEEELWLKAENLRPVDPLGGGLSACSRCGGVAYCDRECQRKDWKQHKHFCMADGPTWEAEYAALRLMRHDLDERSAPYAVVKRAFDRCAFFVERWTQRGRRLRPAAAHQALQEITLFAVAAATLALGQDLTAGRRELDTALWIQAAELAQLHQSWVLSQVPRFHIAHSSILYHMYGLVTLTDLHDGARALEPHAAGLRQELLRQLDVFGAFNPDLADAIKMSADMSSTSCHPTLLGGGDDAQGGGLEGLLKSVGSSSGSMGGGFDEAKRLMQTLASDPEKMRKFQELDPSAPLEQRMQVMAELLDTMPPRASSARTPANRREGQQNSVTSTASLSLRAPGSTSKFPREIAKPFAPLIVEVDAAHTKGMAAEPTDDCASGSVGMVAPTPLPFANASPMVPETKDGSTIQSEPVCGGESVPSVTPDSLESMD